jgi:hypothetical protein
MALIALLSTVPWVEVTVGAQGRNWRADLVVPTLSDIDGCDLAGHRSASRSHRGNAASSSEEIILRFGTIARTSG